MSELRAVEEMARWLAAEIQELDYASWVGLVAATLRAERLAVQEACALAADVSADTYRADMSAHDAVTWAQDTAQRRIRALDLKGK